eukprot:gene3714-5772_t
MTKLFTAIQVGEFTLKHRVALAPLTRCRASEPSLGPSKLAAEYYSQRATDGGLVISEATSISPDALGYASTPGIWTTQQVDEWKPVTEAVKAKGGVFFCQLWHVGRVSHPSFKSHPLLTSRTGPFSSSDLPAPGLAMTYEGMKPHEPPVPLTIDGIKRTVSEYVQAAKNAIAAGFSGVEVHSAHGYLLDQFVLDGVNKRTDQYGGSIENRIRFSLEVLEAVCKAVGPQRVAVRLSPITKDSFTFFGATDSNPVEVYSAFVAALNQFNLAYVLISEPRVDIRADVDPLDDKGFSTPLINGERYRKIYKGTLMGAGGFTPKSAKEAVDEGIYDMIAFGRWFISNPDLPARLQSG